MITGAASGTGRNTALRMPQQAPPVVRITATAAGAPGETPGVRASLPTGLLQLLSGLRRF